MQVATYFILFFLKKKKKKKRRKKKNASCRDKDKREIINVCGVIGIVFLWLVLGLIREKELKNTSCRDKDKRGG
jgi:hypothetical protein